MLLLYRVVKFGSLKVLHCVLANHYVGVKSPISPIDSLFGRLAPELSPWPRQFPITKLLQQP
jgi:hypothetical protein